MNSSSESKSTGSPLAPVGVLLLLGGAIYAYVWLSSAGPYGEVAKTFVANNATCQSVVGTPVTVTVFEVNYSDNTAHARNSAGGEDTVWLECTVSGPKGSASAIVTMTAEDQPHVTKVELSPDDGRAPVVVTP